MRKIPAMPVTIACLEAVQAVAASGTMSGAASRLGRSQSAVSQLVSQAEASLGCTLFDRSSRPFRATKAGVELLRHAARILHDLQALPGRLDERVPVRPLDLTSTDRRRFPRGPP